MSDRDDITDLHSAAVAVQDALAELVERLEDLLPESEPEPVPDAERGTCIKCGSTDGDTTIYVRVAKIGGRLGGVDGFDQHDTEGFTASGSAVKQEAYLGGVKWTSNFRDT